MKPSLKTVISVGMEWTVISRNERGTTHAGRHFFACRCRPGRPWHIHEHDTPVSAGSHKVLRWFTNNYEISELSNTVREICGEQPIVRQCAVCYGVAVPKDPWCPHCGADWPELHPFEKVPPWIKAPSQRAAA